jgi:hypothetical protein
MTTAALLLAGILPIWPFTETVTPKNKDGCVSVEYKAVSYRAVKVVKYLLTGHVVVTMQPALSIDELIEKYAGGKQPKGREIELGGYDSLTDDAKCACPFGAKCLEH